MTKLVTCNTGYSYAKFSGPVTGQSQRIVVDDAHHGRGYDFVAKPNYAFEYGVEDPKSEVSQHRQEHRNGDAVSGEYTVHQPDGKLRLVKYHSDGKNGLQMEVYLDGKPLYHELEETHGPQAQLVNHNQETHHEPAPIQQPQPHINQRPQQPIQHHPIQRSRPVTEEHSNERQHQEPDDSEASNESQDSENEEESDEEGSDDGSEEEYEDEEE